MKTNRVILIALMLACVSSVAFSQAPDPVAKVNSEPISLKQLQDTLIEWYGKQVLEEMVQTAVIAQAAKNVTVTEEQIQERLVAMQQGMDERAKTGQGEPFNVWLATRHMTIANLKARIRSELLLQGLVERQVSVSKEDVSNYYAKNQHMFKEPTAVKISVISLKTKEKADEVRATIASGAKTWGDAARDHNVNPYTMKTGGAFGYQTNDGTPITDAAFALEHDGDMSEVIRYGGLFNIIKREDRRNERTVPFEEVRDSVEQMLKDRQTFALMQETRTALLKSAHIERLIEFAPGPADTEGGE